MRVRQDLIDGRCRVVGCPLDSTVVDATGRLAPDHVPLCDKHWAQRCDELEAQAWDDDPVGMDYIKGGNRA